MDSPSVSVDPSSTSDDSAAENRNPLTARRIQSFSSAYSDGPSTTYCNQNKLPRLPMPTLQETLEKFPQTLEALQDEKQKQATKEVVQEFLHGDGPTLQKALIEYERKGEESGTLGSYVEEFWNDSYLSPDDSVVLNLNPYFVLESGPDAKIARHQLARAASLCFASIKLASMLKTETLKPDTFKGRPLCMDQFKVLFGSSRQPRLDSVDDVHVYRESSHVVVLCKNQFYLFPALWPESGHVAVDEADIQDILEAIVDNAKKEDPKEATKNAIGVFTSLRRSEWAKARSELCKMEVNEKSLYVIDSALFVLVLDDYHLPDIHAKAANMLHGTNELVLQDGEFLQTGTCLNRWYDKLQLIVCRNGTAGVNFEHSSIDGHTALRMVSDIFAETVVAFADSITQLVHGHGKIPHVVEAPVKRAATTLDNEGRPLLDLVPKKLVFELSEPLIERIYFAETALADQMVSNDSHVLEFKDYGKILIVGNSMSPDSLVQMSILLAYYKLYGQVVCQYEPVLTKCFYHGRTEAMRSTTPEARDLCETWCSKQASPQKKLEALHRATKEHSRLVKESAGGKGVDRHLFALKCIAKRVGVPLPAFYQSDAWNTLNHTILSTSNCGNPSLKIFGFGPVVQDGFGVGYIIKDHGLTYSVSSKHRQTQRYVHTLNVVLKEIQDLLKPLSALSQVMKRRSLKSTAQSKVPSSKIVSPNTYDDIYGETSDKIPPMAPAAARPKIGGDQRHNKSRYFKLVKERHDSLDLSDIPHEDVGFGEGEAGHDYGAM